VLAGDIYQIESIDFGNWFFYAKEILPEKSIVELDNTWRTNEPTIKDLWEEVRFLRPIITEKLVINGPFSEDIGKNIFAERNEDEIVLCLNYDGKFGLNSINSYFQDANPSQKAYYWSEWKYKIGDPILFNENKRFPMLYNNLKGVIVDIQIVLNSIKFIIDIPIILTAIKVRGTDLEIVSHSENSTRIGFSVYANDDNQTDEDYEVARMKSVIPFQLAYAVSIHKAQGLEYNSVKVVIPQSNTERITHGIFYTAITRTKQKLKIYWSPETMTDIIAGFNEEKKSRISLDIIKDLISSN
jgi:ATP-dependent exoDNAse (exonuclease V) alpha subunit